MAVDTEVGLGIVALVLLAFSGEASAAEPEPEPEPDSDDGVKPWTEPVTDLKPNSADRRYARDKLCKCYRDGKKTMNALILCTLRELDPRTGPKPPWKRIVNKPLPDDHPSLARRVALISTWASLAIETKGKWCEKKPGEPDKDDEEPAPIDPGPPLPELVDVYPTPAHFYRVQFGDTGYGVAYKYLRSAGFLAAQKWGKADDATANAFGKKVAASQAHQKAVWRAISCNGWNDATVTTYGWKSKSQPLAPTGRVVRMIPQHADNLARLAAKMPALRTIKWGSPADKGKGGGVSVTSDRKLETLWLPGCNLQRLWDSDGVILTFGGGEWGNSGISDVFPPPWVLDLGVTFAKGAQPNVSTFGCDGQELEF